MSDRWQVETRADGDHLEILAFSPDGKGYAARSDGPVDAHVVADLLRQLANRVLELTTHVAKGPLGTDDPE
ncbi:MAG: hypothetical protein K2X43_01235 [Hyphomonadaceae bacterium]|jgi:hypothetical protein|nr:hypothetical protein [Hyphomonadaceae bacterium]